MTYWSQRQECMVDKIQVQPYDNNLTTPAALNSAGSFQGIATVMVCHEMCPKRLQLRVLHHNLNTNHEPPPCNNTDDRWTHFHLLVI